MKKKPSKVRENDDMRPEYDFSGGVRGKYAKRFRTARAVNHALRSRPATPKRPESKSGNERRAGRRSP